MFCGMATTHFETGIFHVMTHAFFKALLFLGAGAVIHALHGEQDIRKMGGLRKELPVLAAVFIIGSLALSGFPGLAGFFSKDAILAAVYERAIYPVFGIAWVMLLLTALLTAFYSTRLFCIVFLGEKQATDDVAGAHGHDDAQAAPHGGIHKPGLLMMVPLVILALLSIGGGYFKKDVAGFLEKTYGAAASEAHESAGHALNQNLSVAVFVIGFVAAYFLYLIRREWAAKLVGNPLHTILYNKFYVDEIYHWTIVAPLRMGAAMLWFVVDRLLIDTVLVNGAGWVAYKAGNGMGRMHRGAIAAGAALTALGAALILRFDLVIKAWHWLGH
jgi:NADH-quinone oxidoreductase subunit L